MTRNLEVLEVLTHAATSAQLVTVELRDGRHFSDGVCEVFSRCGTDFVIFHARNCVYVDDITHCQPVAHVPRAMLRSCTVGEPNGLPS